MKMKFFRKLKTDYRTTYIIGRVYFKIATDIKGCILNKFENDNQGLTEGGVAIHTCWLSLLDGLINIGPSTLPLTKSDWFKFRRKRKFKKFKYYPNNVESFGWYKNKIVCINLGQKEWEKYNKV